ncbi:MAG: DUF4012 domain-containing protein [Anaerolineae bacterium]|nr:DUF4012 domain-containing protein [Anaerolineae bacterium]
MTVNSSDLNPTDPSDILKPESTRRRRRRSRTPLARLWRRLTRGGAWRYVLIAIILLIAIPTTLLVVFAADANARVQESLGNVSRVVSLVSGTPFSELKQSDFERLRASAFDLATTLGNAKSQTNLLRIFSPFSADLRGTFTLLDSAEGLALSAEDVMDGLQPVLYSLVGESSSGATAAPTLVGGVDGERLIELLQIGQGKFISGRERLSQIKTLLDSPDLRTVSPQLVLQVQQVQQYFTQLNAITEILQVAPELMTRAFGVDSPQNYLVLSANNDELRPSGGYLSTYGWLRVRRFRITDYGYSATTATSPNPPPESLASQLNIPSWWIQFPKPIYTAWDSSWFADFPSTAQMSMWYYESGNNPRSPIDGVISIDITGFEKLLGAIGSVRVGDDPQAVTVDNFREIIYEIRAEGQAELAHKQYLVSLYRQILSAWQSVSREKGQALFNALLSGLQEKHIMIYFKEPQLNDLMDLLGWSGKQQPGSGDYLMVADANLGNKSNHSIQRTLTYDVQIQPNGTVNGRATIAYDYSAAAAANDPAMKPEHYRDQIDYFNLMQLFVPKGTVISASDNLNSPVTDMVGTTTDFIATILVKYDTTERYQYEYTTPVVVESLGPYRRYRLLLQKQPGTRDDPVTIQVTLPANAVMVSVSPEPAASYTLDKPILEFRLTLTSDRQIEIVYQ